MNDSFDFHCESGVLGKGFRKICAVKPYELSNLTELFFYFLISDSVDAKMGCWMSHDNVKHGGEQVCCKRYDFANLFTFSVSYFSNIRP